MHARSDPDASPLLALLVLLVGLVLLLLPSSAVADISDFQVISPPAVSLEEGNLESDGIILFQEARLRVLTESIPVDITVPGSYAGFDPLSPGTVPAGTRVHSTFFHFDRLPPDTCCVQAIGSLTFDMPILGLVVAHATLAATHSSLGSPVPLSYAITTRNPGLDLPGTPAPFLETIALSADFRTVTMQLAGAEHIDQLRVVTAAEPTSLVLLCSAAALVLGARRIWPGSSARRRVSNPAIVSRCGC